MNRVDDYDFDSVGKPFPRVRIRLAPDGEILAKGENVFAGYYKDEAATAAMFDAEGWLKTGDLGCFNERGFLQIIGRKKEILVTSGGKNIPPQNIELRFRNDSLISQVVVYGDGKRYLTALVDINEQTARAFLAEAGEPDPGSIRDHPLIRRLVGERIAEVNRGLASFETIKDFVIAGEPLTVESGMLTPSLKIRRAKIYESYRAALESLYRSRSR
jgi:long-chain acyl-CoA synthetase